MTDMTFLIRMAFFNTFVILNVILNVDGNLNGVGEESAGKLILHYAM